MVWSDGVRSARTDNHVAFEAVQLGKAGVC